jgi:hypothetical protein
MIMQVHDELASRFLKKKNCSTIILNEMGKVILFPVSVQEQLPRPNKDRSGNSFGVRRGRININFAEDVSRNVQKWFGVRRQNRPSLQKDILLVPPWQREDGRDLGVDFLLF